MTGHVKEVLLTWSANSKVMTNRIPSAAREQGQLKPPHAGEVVVATGRALPGALCNCALMPLYCPELLNFPNADVT